MARRNKIDSKEIGLELATILGQYFHRTDLLHYGYWTDDIELDVSNMRAAQEAYCDLLVSLIPKGAKSLLDVGCGTGAMADRLLKLGHDVDCVSPGPFLASRALARLDGRGRLYQCRYEDLETDRRYDVVMFAESFQYLKLDRALDQTLRFLGDEGHVLIADVFNKDLRGGSALPGGHRLSRFREAIAKRPFEQVQDLDITDQTSPSLDLALEINTKVVKPAWQLVQKAIAANHPVLNRALRWIYRRKIEKIDRKFASGERNAANFRKYRTYRAFVYRKRRGAGT